MAEVSVDPHRLRAAAKDMSDATRADGQAQRQFGQAARQDAAVFGYSPQARALAQEWADAVAARAYDAHMLAMRTSQLSQDLDTTAGGYDQSDRGNAASISTAGAALDQG